MKAFGIIGPPAILFFDRSGEEMKAYRLVGYFEAEEFAAHLQQVLPRSEKEHHHHGRGGPDGGDWRLFRRDGC